MLMQKETKLKREGHGTALEMRNGNKLACWLPYGGWDEQEKALSIPPQQVLWSRARLEFASRSVKKIGGEKESVCGNSKISASEADMCHLA